MEPRKEVLEVDKYIVLFPVDVQELLMQIRNVVKEEVPEAEETISYGIPTFKLNGNLVHYAAFKNHIGFYPTPAGIEYFKEKLAKYNQGKGSVQFPVNEPMPLDLIREIVRFRVAQNLEKAQKKTKKK